MLNFLDERVCYVMRRMTMKEKEKARRSGRKDNDGNHMIVYIMTIECMR